jgi:hypothetical protein
MRKRQTFLLTILTPENGDASLCGRIKVVSSGETYNFTCQEELNQILASKVEEQDIFHQFARRERKNGSA